MQKIAGVKENYAENRRPPRPFLKEIGRNLSINHAQRTDGIGECAFAFRLRLRDVVFSFDLSEFLLSYSIKANVAIIE